MNSVDISNLHLGSVGGQIRTPQQDGSLAPTTQTTATGNQIPDVSTGSVNNTQTAEKLAQQTQTSVDALKAAANTGNNILQEENRNIQFQVDDATKRVVVKVVDSQTGQVVTQIPTVAMLDLIKQMETSGTASGAILKGTA